MEYLNAVKLGQYLEMLFPNESWEYNKSVPNSGIKHRPDYRCERLKIIVEFDGYYHYQSMNTIVNDWKKDSVYSVMGYKIIRIPYFIQIDSITANILFDVTFNLSSNYPHGFIDNAALLPCDYCEVGIEKFKNDLNRFAPIYSDIINSLKEKILQKKNVNLVLPPSLHYIAKHD